MKKTLLSLLLFTIFCSTLYIVFLFIHATFFPKSLAGNIFKYDQSADYALSRLNEADTTKNVDVLIIGSSHAYRGYDVRLFEEKGIKAFNLGTSAQTLMQTKYLVDKYIDRLNPKIIILDIYPAILNNDGLESTLELLSISKPDTALSKMALMSYDMKAYNSLVYYSIRNNAKYFRFTLKDKESPVNTYIKGGFVENKTIGRINKYGKVKLVFSLAQHKCLFQMLLSFKKRNIKYYIFQSPIAKRRYNSITNNSEIDQELGKFGEYYNFNAEHFLNDDCFIDDHHVNSRGVKIYNKYVFEKILKN